MKIGMIQSPVTASKEANLANAEQAIARAAADGADVAVLPEMFNCPYYNAAFVANAEPADGESVARLRAAAAQNRVYLVGAPSPCWRRGISITPPSSSTGPAGSWRSTKRSTCSTSPSTAARSSRSRPPSPPGTP